MLKTAFFLLFFCIQTGVKTIKSCTKLHKKAYICTSRLQTACKLLAKKTQIMATTKLFLDKRSGDGPYPLKLTITHDRKAAHLNLNIKLNPEQWDGVKVVKHPRCGMLNNQLISRKTEIDCKLYEWAQSGLLKGKTAINIKAMIEADEKGDTTKQVTFGEHFYNYAQRKKGQTYTTYMFTYKTLSSYCDINSVSFEEITPRWLEDFENFCSHHSRSTRNIHFRYIRAAFNDAIDEGYTANYPFRKFKIKAGETRDRALSLEQLRELWNWPVEENQVKYLEIFKLIFLLRGINLIDLCHLTIENVRRGRIYYDRSKTRKPYSIKIEPEIQELLDKYKGEKYLINILDRYKNHVSYISRINKELKKIGTISYGKRGKKTIKPLIPGLSSYWARHTFASIGFNHCGLSMDEISDELGHSYGMAVTNVYVRKDEKRIDAAARKIIDKVLYDK